MNSLSLQRVSELIRGVIELLWSRPEGLYAKEVVAHLPEIVKMTGHETGISPISHIPRYEWTIRIAILPLVKAGWLIKADTGRWLLSEDGRNACKKFSNPQELILHAIRLSEEPQRSIPKIQVSLDLIREKAQDTIATFIREKNIMEVRRLVAALLGALQYHTIWVAPPHKDHGLIDLVANIDPIGAKACRVLVQIKHTGQSVTIEGIKSFLSVLGPNDFGLFFSTSGFTTEARRAISKGDHQKINAMDLEKFIEVWIRHYEKLSREAHQILPLRAIFFLSPPD